MTADQKLIQFNLWQLGKGTWIDLEDYGLQADEVIRYMRGYEFEDDVI